MSSIWDLPDSPEEIARQAREAEEARKAAHAARMRALYAKALGCSMVSPEDAGSAAESKGAGHVTP
ncbi:MAG: hypothetical protein ACO38V_05755 [Phycisphaerales bacterium]